MPVTSNSSRRKLLVASATYKRNDLLDGLLKSLRDVHIPDGVEVEFLIIDNEKSGGARHIVEKWISQFEVPLHYEIEEAPGVTHVRNRALVAAANFDFLAFIDDDEFASADWLVALVERYDVRPSAAVFGPVESVYSAAAPQWIRDWGVHGTPMEADEDQTKPGATCNCLIEMKTVSELGLTFEPRMSLLGGEDTLFFTRMLDAGRQLTRAKDALVYEHVPDIRANSRWLMRRWYRTGISDALIAGRNLSPFVSRVRALFHGVIRVVVGALLVAIVWLVTLGRNPRKILERCYTVCRGAGMISFATGRTYEEYGRAS
jgi:succinoglycan biosynthesis protein ExoM